MTIIIDSQGNDIPRKYWNESLVIKAKEEKAKIPFQIGLIRNFFIFVAILAVLSIVMPIVNKNKVAIDIENNLNQRISDIKAGDIYHCYFRDDKANDLGISTMKITKVQADTISFVTSEERIENTFANLKKEVNFNIFKDQAMTFNKNALIKSQNDHSLASIAKNSNQRAYLLGKRLGVNN